MDASDEKLAPEIDLVIALEIQYCQSLCDFIIIIERIDIDCCVLNSLLSS